MGTANLRRVRDYVLLTNVNQEPLPRLSKAPLVRASLVKQRYIKYLALLFYKATIKIQ